MGLVQGRRTISMKSIELNSGKWRDGDGKVGSCIKYHMNKIGGGLGRRRDIIHHVTLAGWRPIAAKSKNKTLRQLATSENVYLGLAIP